MNMSLRKQEFIDEVNRSNLFPGMKLIDTRKHNRGGADDIYLSFELERKEAEDKSESTIDNKRSRFGEEDGNGS